MPLFAHHNSGIGVYTLCSSQGLVYELDFLGVFTNASTWLLHLGIAPSSGSPDVDFLFEFIRGLSKAELGLSRIVLGIQDNCFEAAWGNPRNWVGVCRGFLKLLVRCPREVITGPLETDLTSCGYQWIFRIPW